MTPPSTKLNCARTDCEHGLVPAPVTRRSQDWTGHRLGGIKPGGPVRPQWKAYAFADLVTTSTGDGSGGTSLIPMILDPRRAISRTGHFCYPASCNGGCRLPLGDPRPSSD